MEITQFGVQKGKKIMLLHGNLMCWRQFEDVIPLLENTYCVYAVSFDGFDGTGEITYTTAQEQAHKLEAYIRENCGGHLNVLFAESLGCGPAILLKSSPQVQIDHMILSGSEYLDFGILNKLLLKIMPQKQYKTAREKSMPLWVLRLYLYRMPLPVQPDAQIACWYGEKEGHMKKAIQKLLEVYPKLAVRCFPSFGHGDIINHPALLVSELKCFCEL